MSRKGRGRHSKTVIRARFPTVAETAATLGVPARRMAFLCRLVDRIIAGGKGAR